ncbi:arylamine N-acetyltransferase [Defluviimonas sp. WL0002]|uniref:Arylamine N-acetyltransferase n=1 Tax=Albidovulum marisflavi TaxID=2984159 RepID=A0ABT2ZFY4_9RHOB|nr:arylamine N-acetyltransferase [Defluviimonas sp. WL0002]MCV2870058.1 arylamine N-acetyltransferase [Defluviimonas sp. WL0002]
MPLNLPRYLDRIAIKDEAPSPEGLSRLQAAQLRAIAFENTEPLLGVVPDLSLAAVQQKLVVAKRGGYCLELNALFGAALGALGYQARPVLGRVRMGAATGGPRAHLAHIVQFGDRAFLADTGFGGPAPEAPIEIGTGTPVADRLGQYRLRRDAATEEWVLERETTQGWFSLYGFDTVPVTEPDRIAANFFCARFPASPFPNHLMLNRVTETGRVSLFDRKLTKDDTVTELRDSADLADALRDQFRLPYDCALARNLWHKLAPEALVA